MPRTLLGDEIIESLSNVAAYREVVGVHGDSLTTVASAVGSNTDTVAAGTNFGSNDPAYIAGDQGAELNEVSAIATNVITWKRKRLYADSIGAVVKEMLRIPLGHIGEDSAEISGAPTINAVPAATSKTPVTYLSVAWLQHREPSDRLRRAGIRAGRRHTGRPVPRRDWARSDGRARASLHQVHGDPEGRLVGRGRRGGLLDHGFTDRQRER
jgi:hypothetical protein